MNPQDIGAKKSIQYDDPLLKDNTKYGLLSNIKISAVDNYVLKGRRVYELQDTSQTIYVRNKIIK